MITLFRLLNISDQYWTVSKQTEPQKSMNQVSRWRVLNQFHSPKNRSENATYLGHIGDLWPSQAKKTPLGSQPWNSFPYQNWGVLQNKIPASRVCDLFSGKARSGFMSQKKSLNCKSTWRKRFLIKHIHKCWIGPVLKRRIQLIKWRRPEPGKSLIFTLPAMARFFVCDLELCNDGPEHFFL